MSDTEINLDPERSTNCLDSMTFAVTKDLVTGNLIHNPMNTIAVMHKLGQHDVVFLINNKLRLSNRIMYKVKDIDGFYDSELNNGWLAIRFLEPKHMIILYTQCLRERGRFWEWFVNPLLISMGHIGGIVLDKAFNPKLSEFMGCEYFNRKTMDIGCLSTIILEDVNLKSLPESLGHTPISYISLSRSTLGLSNGEPETFWNWMLKSTICDTLKVLELNSNDLEGLPFEIIFLKELTTLSVSKNKLTFIPHFIGELKKLRSMFIDNNKLRYLPECLQTRMFEFINYSNNDFESFNELLLQEKPQETWSLPQGTLNLQLSSSSSRSKPNTKLRSCVQLSHLSLFCLINNHVQFKREDLCLAVVKYFDKIFRCASCHKLMIAESEGLYDLNFAKSKSFIKTKIINWQYFKCNYNCINFDNIFSIFPEQKTTDG